jgi:hypothetical protein
MLPLSSDVWIPWWFFAGDGSKNGVTKKKKEEDESISWLFPTTSLEGGPVTKIDVIDID